MSEFEINIDLPGSAFNECILVEKYKNEYALVLAKKGDKGGTVWKKWVYPQIGKGKIAEKAIPLKIPLGNATDAITVIKQIANAFNLQIVEGGKVVLAKPEDDDIPF